MAGRGLFTRDFIVKNQWICEYGGELQHASSFPGGFPQGANGNTHTRGVEPMFSRLQAKNLTPQNADGKLASFANDTRDSKTNSAAFQRKHVTTKAHPEAGVVEGNEAYPTGRGDLRHLRQGLLETAG